MDEITTEIDRERLDTGRDGGDGEMSNTHTWVVDDHDYEVHCHCGFVGTHTMDEDRANALEAVLTAARTQSELTELPSRETIEAEGGGHMHFAQTGDWLQAITAQEALEAAIRAVDGEAEGTDA